LSVIRLCPSVLPIMGEALPSQRLSLIPPEVGLSEAIISLNRSMR